MIAKVTADWIAGELLAAGQTPASPTAQAKFLDPRKVAKVVRGRKADGA
jgi:hypothetical protein